MAGRRRTAERVEPSFGDRRGDGDIRVSSDDRAVRGGSRSAGRASPTERTETNEKRRRFFGGGSGREPARRRRRSFFGHLFRLLTFGAIWGSVAVVGVVAWFALSLPSEAWTVPARPPNVKIVSVAGEPFANRGLTGGQALSLAEMSPFIPKAVIAIEDRRFYDHHGVDPVGVVRAFSENMAAGATVQGGSTLTQQLAKNIFLTPEQSLKRKGQEAILALWLERKFTKDQILEMYLNRVYFGSGATGVEAAAQRYFRKGARDVTLSEAALLAGLLKAPSRLTPARDPKAAKARADVVLQAMLDEKLVTAPEFDAAKAEKPIRAKSFWNGAENYAADIVMRDLSTLVGEVKNDVVVETTLDLELERAAEKAIRATIDGAKRNVSQGALVAIDGTGAIRALVGGRDYAESQFNRAVDAKRQPGSAFKPFVYQAALEAGWRPDSAVNDTPIRIGAWSPQNYDQRFRGPVTLGDALAQSLNTVAAQLTETLGTRTVIDTAARMGVKTPLVDNASIALGTSEVGLMELTGAFAPFANGGYRASPHLVNRVTDAATGRVLFERAAEVPPVIVRGDVVGMMNAMLTGTVTRGTGRAAALKGWQAAGKTGTTQDFKDAWFVGYTANLTTGVWFGNDNGALMRKVTGGTRRAQAGRDFMAAAHDGRPPMPLPGAPTGDEPAAEALTAANGTDGRDVMPVPENEIAPANPALGNGQPETREIGRAVAGREAPSFEEEARRAIRRGAERPAPELDEEEAPYDPDEDTYDIAPLPPADDPYGDGLLAEDGFYEPPPVVREPSRLVRRDQLPPDAVLEGPLEPAGRAGDRRLLRDFLGG